jgi:hypothetical protein
VVVVVAVDVAWRTDSPRRAGRMETAEPRIGDAWGTKALGEVDLGYGADASVGAAVDKRSAVPGRGSDAASGSE